MSRTITLVTISNNPQSEEALSVDMQIPNGFKFIQGIAVAGIFLIASGGAAPYSYAESGGLAAAGLTLNTSTGEITGTPSSAGTVTYAGTVTDGATNTATNNFSFDVISQLNFEGVGPADDDFGFSGSYGFKASDISGATGSITWSASGLPAHYSFNALVGLLSWTSAAGSSSADTTSHFTVSAADSGTGQTFVIPVSHTIYKSFSIANSPPNLTIPCGYTTQFDLNSLISPSGFKQPYTYSIVSSYPWLSITPAGFLTATPPANFLSTGGSSSFTLTLNIASDTTWGHFAVVNFPVLMTDPRPSADTGNALTHGSDGALFVSPVPGSGMFVDIVKQFGADPTGVADCSTALANAIASFTTSFDGNTYSYAGTIWFPPGQYYFASTININRQVRLLGAGSPAGNAIGISQLLFNDNIDGIAINHANVPTNGVSLDAAGTMLDGLYLKRSKNTSGTTGNGVKASTRFEIRNCMFDSFRGDGIHIAANSGGTPPTNANNWHIQNSVCVSNGVNGLFVQGADTNIGTCIGLDCRSNGQDGIHDENFLGDSYFGCHTASNARYGYYTNNSNAEHVFVGCYTEGGESHSVIFPSIIYGGILATVGTAVGTATIYGNKITQNLQTYNASANCLNWLGGDVSGNIWAFAGGDEGASFKWRWKQRTGGYFFDWSNTLNNIWGLLNSQATVANGFPRDCTHATIARIQGSVFMREGMFFGTNYNFIQDFVSLPSGSDTYEVGDWGYYRTPVAGGYFGGLVTARGAPATWMEFAPTAQRVVAESRKASLMR